MPLGVVGKLVLSVTIVLIPIEVRGAVLVAVARSSI